MTPEESAQGGKVDDFSNNDRLCSLVNLCRELMIETDGVAMPATAAAILNAINRIVDEIDDD